MGARVGVIFFCFFLVVFLLLLILLFIGVSENLVRYLWLSLVSLIYLLVGSSFVLVLFLTPLALRHLYGQSSNIVLLSLTKPLYAAMLFSVLPLQLVVLATVCVLLKYLPETGLQWFTMRGRYFLFFRLTNLLYVGVIVYVYMRRLTTMNLLVLVLRLPVTVQGFLKGSLRSCGPGSLLPWVFLSMFLLFILNLLVVDVSVAPGGVQESTIMMGGLFI